MPLSPTSDMTSLDWHSQGKTLPRVFDKAWHLRENGVAYSVEAYDHDIVVAQIASDLHRFSVRGTGSTVQEALNQCDANIEVIFQAMKRPLPRLENLRHRQNDED